MLSARQSNLEETESCDCCHQSTDTLSDSYGCTERRTVFTQREQEILRRIREAGEQARKIRKKIEQLSAQPQVTAEEGEDARRELEHLRQVRSELEQERIAAAEERMRLLGHI